MNWSQLFYRNTKMIRFWLRRMKFTTAVFAVPACLLILIIIYKYISFSPVGRFGIPPKKPSKVVADKCSVSNWPTLDLFLPLASTFEEASRFRDIFLHSYDLFWPYHNQDSHKLLIITEGPPQGDELALITIEEEMTHLLGPNNKNQRKDYEIILSDGLPGQAGQKPLQGIDLQRWLTFWADNFTKAEYVGFVDSDTVFVTRVARRDVFLGRKPIIKADFTKSYTYDSTLTEEETAVPKATSLITGHKAPFSCNGSFPVVIKTSHLKLIRRHIRHQMKSHTFADAFQKIISADRKHFSQFDVMCTYLWYYHRKDYHWSLFVSPGLSGYWEATPQLGGGSPEGKKVLKKMSQSMTLRHGPRVAAHWSYETYYHKEYKDWRDGYMKLLRTGVCYSMPENHRNRPMYCYRLPPRALTINSYEWVFGGVSRMPSLSFALLAHKRRLENVDSCPHYWQMSKTFKGIFKFKKPQ